MVFHDLAGGILGGFQIVQTGGLHRLVEQHGGLRRLVASRSASRASRPATSRKSVTPQITLLPCCFHQAFASSTCSCSSRSSAIAYPFKNSFDDRRIQRHALLFRLFAVFTAQSPSASPDSHLPPRRRRSARHSAGQAGIGLLHLRLETAAATMQNHVQAGVAQGFGGLHGDPAGGLADVDQIDIRRIRRRQQSQLRSASPAGAPHPWRNRRPVPACRPVARPARRNDRRRTPCPARPACR
jgi:hypothetical protein